MFSFLRYDHLAKVLTKVLDERPENVADVFEDISSEEKRAKFTSDSDTVQDKVDKTTEVALAEIQEKLFKVRKVPVLNRHMYNKIRILSPSNM